MKYQVSYAGDSALWAGTFSGGLNKIRLRDVKINKITFREGKYSPTNKIEDSGEDEENASLFKREKKFLEELERIILSLIDADENNVEAIAQSIGMSRKSLYRKIKAITGQNINEYSRMIKIKRAAKLISENGYNISEAAFAVGFSSVKYFRKLFKDQYGKLPSDLLKEKEIQ